MSNSKNQTPYDSIRTSERNLAPDHLFDLFASERRRILLAVLHERSPPLSSAELAEAVAAREADDAPRDLVERVQVSLHHAHLPKLSDAGLVSYDPAQSVVRDVADGIEALPFVEER
ncbi:DUF7344 domain-containing protein [Halomicrococcus gelatinilyticus]|uniref:DUF7344 domain-containing protein n=1 Tax=Halomicrococcus gelatinilyticus TaxID=1702103 RepID=UPI002E131369